VLKLHYFGFQSFTPLPLRWWRVKNLWKLQRWGKTKVFNICGDYWLLTTFLPFWSLILDFCCSFCFIVSLVLHLATSFVRIHVCETTKVRKAFDNYCGCLSAHLFHWLSPSHENKSCFCTSSFQLLLTYMRLCD